MADLTSAPPRFPKGEYEIEDVVGKGGMAIVYRARDLRHPRMVAIKVLRPEVAQSIGSTRFLREIAVAAPFSHPHILPLIDSGLLTDDQGRTTPYYVMPLVDGETLHQKLVREGRLPVRVALRITREILEALQYAHAHGVIHRDIKPANILLSGGHAVVADFGVSRPLPQAVSDDPAEPGLTMTGDVIGTPSYMSPEQALGHRIVDARSDIFSVGCVMYEMLVGDRPFDTPIPQYTATKKRHGIYTSARDARPDVSAALDAVLAKALKAEPEERYASAAAFLFAISTLEEEDTTSGWGMMQQPVPGWVRNVAIGTLAVVGVVAATLRSGRTSNAEKTVPTAPAIASDKSRVAVLPIELLMPDSVLNIVANGFQTDLIDELAQFPALTVISKNGVLQFRGDHASTDSVARALNVGSVVTGDIRRVGDSVRVTVRLIDGATGAVRSTGQDSGSLTDLLAVRSSVISSVTDFLRTAIGEELVEHEHQTVRSAEAWELTARVRDMGEAESGTISRLTPAQRQARFTFVDSLLTRAAKLDKGWPAPLSVHGFILIQRATFLEQASDLGAGTRDAANLIAHQLREQAAILAERALALGPENAMALYIRGKARFDLWRASRPLAPDSIRSAAEQDLHAAVTRRPDMAQAWTDLSVLYHMSGANAKAIEAATNALRADAFLRNGWAVAGRRFFASLAAGRIDQAREFCRSGLITNPASPTFWGCELTILGWTSGSAQDVARGWDILHSTEKGDTLRLIASGWATRRLFIAAIAARAGLADSARAILLTVRRAPVSVSAPENADYGEALVQTLLAQTDQALDLLEKFLRNNPALRGQVRESPWFTAIKTKPRFVALTTAAY